jgi:hypothetical protein
MEVRAASAASNVQIPSPGGGLVVVVAQEKECSSDRVSDRRRYTREMESLSRSVSLRVEEEDGGGSRRRKKRKEGKVAKAVKLCASELGSQALKVGAENDHT